MYNCAHIRFLDWVLLHIAGRSFECIYYQDIILWQVSVFSVVTSHVQIAVIAGSDRDIICVRKTYMTPVFGLWHLALTLCLSPVQM